VEGIAVKSKFRLLAFAVFSLFAVAAGAQQPAKLWTIRSNNDGYFQIRSAAGNPQSWVLDGSDAGDTVAAPPNGAPAQEWNVRSLGRGLFQFVNRASGQAASLRGHELGFQITPTL